METIESTEPVITIRSAKEFADKEVTIRGWLYGKRSSGKIHFLLVRDGTGIIQAVVVKSEVSPEIFELAGDLTQESSIIVRGKLRLDKRAPGGVEMNLEDMKVIQLAENYPISRKEHGQDFLMSHRHLWLRSSRQHAIMRVRATVIKAIRDFLDNNGFILIDAPILTPAACEGTTTLFETDYFGESAYLTQSGQLYMEAAAMAFGKVYCFGPTFRAEKSKTRRHLMEFWMVEPEMAYCDLDQNLEIQEELVTYIVKQVLEKNPDDLKVLKRDVGPLLKVEPPFVRLSYDDAVDMLNRGGVEMEWGEDFGSPHETYLTSQFDRPVFVYNFPVQAKAFYMKPNPDRPEVVLCADLLAPEGYGEIIGGGQRADDLEYLKKQVKKHNLQEKTYEWYLDLRKYGSVPHGGFGLGIERTVAWICKIDHVRETIPFARMLTRIYP
ncbi:MAG: asparagine--tRNA ligase [Candidatus Eremiobacteraeota bacterium]|nr:asparagine--tRNA ligase [Candidatus Eremiobacteraeota bacterium]